MGIDTLKTKNMPLDGVSEPSGDIYEDVLIHYGVKRRSGRYPWGSGENPYQHSGDFISRSNELKKSGMTEKEVAEAMGFSSTTDYRTAYSIAKNERRKLDVDQAKSLREDGLTPTEIGRKMGVNESTVRSWLNSSSEDNMRVAEKTAERLKDELKTKHAIDVGSGVERELGVSTSKLSEALMRLEIEGYKVYGVGVPQPNNPKNRTTVKVLADDTVTQRDIYQDYSKIKQVGEYHSRDGGASWYKREYPASLSSKRVQIRYGDEGGSGKDGVIEIRRGVKDLNLGNSHYAQVRILVDGTHYLKGMAMYSDDLPDGVDVLFNTNKKSGTPMISGDKGVLKAIKSDPDNPFGAYIKADGQSYYDDPRGKYTDPKTGKKQSLSVINKLREEGDWETQSRNLSSQFLSKQPIQLIKKQLNLTYKDAEAEYDEIMSYNNPTVRRKMLLDFANSCDSAAVHMKAAALPRQQTRVILPVPKLKETEVYAPYLKNGEKVALVRYPHGGTFEIPILTVNNRNQAAKRALGNALDAIGINSKTAEVLSGADFDGDTVVVIPVNSRVRISAKKPLEGLKGFDPKVQYSTEGKTGVKLMTKQDTQKQMGVVSNLITDMTLRGADDDEIARAVRHSMVVIDAHKHKLDYKQSEKDNGIAELKKKYQIRYDDEGNEKTGGASTLLSRRKQTVGVPERRGSGRIDPSTGEMVYNTTGRTYTDKKTGKRTAAQNKVSRILNIDDVRKLSSGTPKEDAYADYSNKMKALANRARKEYVSAPRLERSPEATKKYKTQVDELNDALDKAIRNQPKERQAIALANSVIKAKIQANPELSDKGNKKELNKITSLALDDARAKVGADGKGTRIDITDAQWEAIQAGAISDSKLQQILRYSDSDAIKQRALPKATTTLSTAKISKLKAMKGSGYTISEIAESLGVSSSTVSKYLNQ